MSYGLDLKQEAATKLAVLCERVIEAGWLLAIVIVPLFFNVYSDRVFEPDKLSVLRSIVLVVIAAWVVRLVEAGRAGGEESAVPLWQRIKATPLAVPTLLLAAVYILSTITSVMPRASLWGSYQRLQGTYSMFSYLIVFAIILSTLRRREQLERLIMMAILVSLPIALYGLVQHFKLDPLPWGGNVTFRVASNMGNSIFVAAYMIMIVPLTLRNLGQNMGKVLENEPGEVKAAFIGGYLLAVVIQFVAWSAIGFTAGVLVGVMFILLTGLFAVSMHKPVVRFFWIGLYSVILVAQLLCILYTQSRGPWIGLGAGIFFFILLLAFTRRIRWLQWTSISLFLLGVVVVGLLNTSLSFVTPLKKLPYVGRLGTIFELEQGTGRVRTLIWEGAVKLLGPHDPIGLPGQQDKLAFLRPLIGYGPESMILAYNPFYPPDLAHVERRNASPDRSHNETFDALINTGIIGFLIYFGLFVSLFYHSLKWLGMLENKRHRNLFLGLSIGSTILVATVVCVLDGGLRLLGVGLPLGLIAGVSLYLIISSFIVPYDETQQNGRQLLLIALLSAIVGHFVEIHFGIAIAVTRLYFWTFTALLVVVGMEWIKLHEPVESPVVAALAPAPTRQPAGRQRGKQGRNKPPRRAPVVQATSRPWPWSGVLSFVLLVGVIYITMSYDFVTNQQGLTGAWAIIANSLTVIVRNDAQVSSYAMLWLFLFTWFAGGILALTQTPGGVDGEKPPLKNYLITLGLYGGIVPVLFLLFALPQAARLEPPSNVGGIITPYYWAAFLMLAAVALALLKERALPNPLARPATAWAQVALVPGSLAVAIFLFTSLNLNMVKADIYYKQAKFFDTNGMYDSAIRYYQECINLAKDQDFYYLFLGRAYLGQANTTEDTSLRATDLAKAQQALEEARGLNPLNTDHTANLARLYRSEAEMSTDSAVREQNLNKASAYYQEATELSPNTARLYNERALVYAMLGENDQAMAQLNKSLSLDQQFDETYVYIGNIYLNEGKYNEAADAYSKAVEIDPTRAATHSALGYVYSRMGELEKAVQENQAVLEISPKDYSSTKNLAILYEQMGNLDQALTQARAALDLAPEDEIPALQAFISQVEQDRAQGTTP